MKLIQRTRPRRIIYHALVVVGLLAFSTAFAQNARTSIQVFKYSGTGGEAAREQFGAFRGIIHTKISSLSEELSTRKHFKNLDELAPFYPEDGAGNHVQFSGSNAELLRRWRNANALNIFQGRISRTAELFFVRSRIFLGDLNTKLNSRFLNIALPISDEQYDTTRDSHSVAILYALAMDAKERCRPENEVMELLSEANERLADLPTTLGDIEILRRAIHDDLETGHACP